MRYSDALMDHFLNPRNVGEMPDADGVGCIGNPSCGDILMVWIKVEEEHVVDVKFKCRGCPAAIGTSSAMTELAMGRHLDAAAEVTPEMITDAVGGLPEEKAHCSNLGAAALQDAIMNYICNSAVTEHERAGELPQDSPRTE